jgi:hypothetical protein
VRSATDVLATLDANGCVDGVPFMPEMVDMCGRTYTVDRRAEKLCDTINASLQSRRMTDAVFLNGDPRCDGSAHGGCEAECRLYWKEVWLRRIESGPAPLLPADPDATARLRSLTEGYATEGAGETLRYRCQATQMVAATSPLSTTDPRPYWREFSSGNVHFGRFVKVMGRAVTAQTTHRLGRLAQQPLRGASPKSPTTEPLDLQPGEWVRVKQPDEIKQTLNDKGANRGLYFDREMVPHCGHVFQVRRRVSRIINERTGEMIELRNDCIALEGAVCSGELSTGRWFCARDIYAYYRECWLERVPAPGTSTAAADSPA